MSQSILNSVKKLLGPGEEYTHFDTAIENLSPALYMASESVYKIVEFMEGLAEEEIYGIMALNTAASVKRSVKKYRETKL